MEGQEDDKIIVQSLIGGSQLPFYLRCLKSLVTFCQDRIDLQLHTDGSLSQEDKDFIHSELDGTMVTITDSSENKNRVLDCLQGRPNCQKLERILFGELSSLTPFSHSPKIRSVFTSMPTFSFFAHSQDYLIEEQVKDGAIFLKDTQWDAYCFRPWQMLAGKKNLRQSKESPQDWCFGINQQSTGITSSGFWESIDFTKFLNGSCPLHKLAWPIDARRKRFPQDI